MILKSNLPMEQAARAKRKGPVEICAAEKLLEQAEKRRGQIDELGYLDYLCLAALRFSLGGQGERAAEIYGKILTLDKRYNPNTRGFILEMRDTSGDDHLSQAKTDFRSEYSSQVEVYATHIGPFFDAQDKV